MELKYLTEQVYLVQLGFLNFLLNLSLLCVTDGFRQMLESDYLSDPR